MFKVKSDFYRSLLLIVLMTLLVLSMPISEAETIKLKNGTVLKGSIVEMDQTDLKLQTADMGTVTLKRSTISSINDGVKVTADFPAAISPQTTDLTSQGGAENVNININNNQNNAQNQTHTASQPVVPNVFTPAMETVSESEQSLYGHLSLGMMYPSIELKDDYYSELDLNGEGFKTAVWEVLNYRGELFSGGLIAQGTKFDTIDGLEGEILFWGGHFDVLFAKHSWSGGGNGFLSLGVLVGATRYKAVFKSAEDSYGVSSESSSEGYEPAYTVGSVCHDGCEIEIKAQGETYGARLSYNYMSSGTFGVVVAANYLEGTLKGKVTDEYSLFEGSKSEVKVKSHSLTAGLLYNFSL